MTGSSSRKMTSPNPNLRRGSAPYERLTNGYQRRLLSTYDSWRRSLSRDLLAAYNRGVPTNSLPNLIHDRLPQLQANLEEEGRKAISAAVRVGVGRDRARTDPNVQALVQEQTQANALLLAALMLDVGNGTSESITSAAVTTPIDRQLIISSFDPYRARVASYSGGAWVAIFESQRRVAIDSNDDRRVRWSLHPTAVHCVASQDHWGCPDLEGVYEDWGRLPTVPAGLVTCRGNCRCHLEVEVAPNEWQRGLGD